MSCRPVNQVNWNMKADHVGKKTLDVADMDMWKLGSKDSSHLRFVISQACS